MLGECRAHFAPLRDLSSARLLVLCFAISSYTDFPPFSPSLKIGPTLSYKLRRRITASLKLYKFQVSICHKRERETCSGEL